MIVESAARVFNRFSLTAFLKTLQKKDNAQYHDTGASPQDVAAERVNLKPVFQIALHAVDFEKLDTDPRGNIHPERRSILNKGVSDANGDIESRKRADCCSQQCQIEDCDDPQGTGKKPFPAFAGFPKVLLQPF